MKFNVRRETLLPVLERLCAVNRNELSGYEGLGQLSVKAEADRVLLATSNGYIKAVQEVKDENLSIDAEGDAVAGAELVKNMVSAATQDSIIVIESDGENYLSREIQGEKRRLKVPLLPVAADVGLQDVGSKASFKVPSDIFKTSLHGAIPLAGTEEYRARYKQIYIEFRQKETRFVCGDGSKFAILVNQDGSNQKKFKNEDDHKGYIIPSEQAGILVLLFDEAQKITINFGRDRYLFETDSGLRVTLGGISRECQDYIPYDVQWQRFGQCAFSAELSRKSLKALVADMEAVRDKDYERRHNMIIPIKLTTGKNEMKCVSNFTNVIDCSVSVEHFKVHKSDTVQISDVFALSIFNEILKFGNCESYEFSFMGVKDIVFCKFLDDDPACPRIMFFAPVKDPVETE